jgi:hypothetical protein
MSCETHRSSGSYLRSGPGRESPILVDLSGPSLHQSPLEKEGGSASDLFQWVFGREGAVKTPNQSTIFGPDLKMRSRRPLETHKCGNQGFGYLQSGPGRSWESPIFGSGSKPCEESVWRRPVGPVSIPRSEGFRIRLGPWLQMFIAPLTAGVAYLLLLAWLITCAFAATCGRHLRTSG